MDNAQIDYRTREFLGELSEMRLPDREYDYGMMKRLGEIVLKARDVVMYEWPELTFMRQADIAACAYEGVRRHPATAGLLVAIKETPYPRNSRAALYFRKKLTDFRDMAEKALNEWKQQGE